MVLLLLAPQASSLAVVSRGLVCGRLGRRGTRTGESWPSRRSTTNSCRPVRRPFLSSRRSWACAVTDATRGALQGPWSWCTAPSRRPTRPPRPNSPATSPSSRTSFFFFFQRRTRPIITARAHPLLIFGCFWCRGRRRSKGGWASWRSSRRRSGRSSSSSCSASPSSTRVRSSRNTRRIELTFAHSSMNVSDSPSRARVCVCVCVRVCVCSGRGRRVLRRAALLHLTAKLRPLRGE